MTPNVQSYLHSWSYEIDARASRVRQLIGDAHWLSDGHHKESVLREFLSRYLPKDFSISRGFVKTTRDLNLCSPEVDILIADPRLNPPFFFEGDLQIVDSSAVIAQVEVKTKLSKQKLTDALLNVCCTQSLIGDYSDTQHIWKGIFFFTSGTERTLESLLDIIESSLSTVAADVSNRSPLVNLIVPTCIATLDRHCCFLQQTAHRTFEVKLFELGTLSFPCAFADMFSALRRRSGGVVLGGLDNVVDSIDVPARLTKCISI